MSKILLYNSSGDYLDEYKPKKIAALIKRGQARWVVEGISAALIHKTEEEIFECVSGFQYDGCAVTGNWRVIQPASRNFRTLCAQLVMPR